MISRFSKFVPLEKPSNESTRLFVATMDQVGARMEKNFSELQSYVDKLESVDIFRASDKEYFDAKVKQTLQDLNGIVDFNSTASQIRAKKSLGTVMQDNRIRNAVTNTSKIRKVMSQWDKISTDPKLASKHYNRDNYLYDMMAVEDYSRSVDENASFSLNSASIYNGENEQLAQMGRELKMSQYEAINAKGDTKLLIKEKNKQLLEGQVDSIPTMTNQNRIELSVALRQNPAIKDQLLASVPQQIRQLEKSLADMEAQEKFAAVGDPTTGAEAQGFVGKHRTQIEYVQNKINNLKNISSLPEDQMLLALYTQNKKDRHVQSNYNYELSTNKNPVFFEMWRMNQAADALRLKKRSADLADKKYDLDVLNSNHDRSMDRQELDLAKQTLEFNREKAMIEAASKGFSGLGNPGATGLGNPFGNPYEPYLMEDTDGVKQPASALQAWADESNKTNQAFSKEMSNLMGLLGTVSQTDKDIVTRITNRLSESGLRVDLNNIKELEKNFNTPENLSKLANVLDAMESNTGDGTLMGSGFGKKISESLINLSKINQKQFLLGYQATAAKELATIQSARTKDSYDNELKKAFEGIGFNSTQGKVIPLSEYSAGSSEKLLQVRNLINSRLKQTKTFIGPDGKNYYLGGVDPKTGKPSENGIDVDFEKSEIISINPNTNILSLNVAARSAVNGKIVVTNIPMKVQLDQSDARNISNSIRPGIYEAASGIRNNMEAEDWLKQPGVSSVVRQRFASLPNFTGGRELGMPSNATISYRMEVTDNDLILHIKDPETGKEFSTPNFTSQSHFKEALRKAYSKNLELMKMDERYKGTNVELEAYKKTIQLLKYRA